MKKTDYEKLMIEALKKHNSNQLKLIPFENEIEYEFSEKFNIKMQKLIEAQNKSQRKIFNSQTAKAVSIILAIILGLAASLKVDAIKEPLFDFFYKIFNTHTYVEYTECENDIIYDYYLPPYIPEGYEMSSETLIIEYSSDIFFSGKDGKEIYFCQESQRTSLSMNSENADLEEISVNNINVLFCDNGRNIHCIWNENGYLFILTYPCELGKEYMYDVVGHLKKVEF